MPRNDGGYKHMAKTSAKAHFTQTLAGKVRWFDVRAPSMAKLKALRDNHLPELIDVDLQDCLPPFQRPKLLQRDAYLFLVLLFPVYDAKNDAIHPYEVDFFIGKDFVATSHAGTHTVMLDLLKDCSPEAGSACPIKPTENGLAFVLEIAHRLMVSCFPLVNSVSNRLTSMESDLRSDNDSALVLELLKVRSNIVTFRKSFQGYEHVMKKLGHRAKALFPDEEVDERLEDIATHGKEIWAFLENDKDTIDALYDSHMAMVTFRTNDATRKLTGLAFVIFPSTLMAAIFSTRAVHMPIIGMQGDFWIIVALVGVTMSSLLAYLWKKGWL